MVLVLRLHNIADFLRGVTAELDSGKSKGHLSLARNSRANSLIASVAWFFVPRGRPAGLPDWPLRKRPVLHLFFSGIDFHVIGSEGDSSDPAASWQHYQKLAAPKGVAGGHLTDKLWVRGRRPHCFLVSWPRRPPACYALESSTV
jgi:hypothetical protein